MMNFKKNLLIEENVELINFINLTGKEKEMVRNWRNNFEIRKWMYTDHIITPEEHLAFIERLRDDNKNFFWVVKDEESGYLGVIYLNQVDWKNKNAYCGIYANMDNKTKGRGKKFDAYLMKVAFRYMNLHTLRLEVIEDNEVVIGLHTKMGLVKEGRLKEYVFKDGKWKDVLLMGIVNRGQ